MMTPTSVSQCSGKGAKVRVRCPQCTGTCGSLRCFGLLPGDAQESGRNTGLLHEGEARGSGVADVRDVGTTRVFTRGLVGNSWAVELRIGAGLILYDELLLTLGAGGWEWE